MQLEEMDSKLFRKYTDLKSSHQIKAMLSKAKAKLDAYETFHSLVRRRREELLKRNKKKDDKNAQDKAGKAKHGNHTFRRIEPLALALRSRRQQSIVESMRNAAERGRAASTLRRLETDV